MAEDAGRRSRDKPACPLCDADLFKRHCKFVCPRHGVVYDCSDPFA